MYDQFGGWLIPKLSKVGFTLQGFPQVSEELTWYEFNTSNGERFDVLYLIKELTSDELQGLFDSEDEPVLFIVANSLVQQFTLMNEKPLWLRALHAIYYGRVYTFNGMTINALHFEWGAGRHSYSEPISVIGISFTFIDSLLKDFPGRFNIARFNDKPFWKEQGAKKPKGETPKQRSDKWREEWEQATSGYTKTDYEWHQQEKKQHKKTAEELNEEIRRAFEEHMRRYNADTWNYPPCPRQQATGDKWFNELVQTGSLEAARTKYKELAKQYHPDLHVGDSSVLATMQDINAAFDKVKAYYE